jgi:hypothetical protein
MADRTGLKIVGWAFGGVTATVALIAVLAVTTANLDRSGYDAGSAARPATSAAQPS